MHRFERRDGGSQWWPCWVFGNEEAMKRVCVQHGVRCPTSPPVQITRFQQDTRISAQIHSSKRLIGKVLDLKNLMSDPKTCVAA